jgi:hypothetical protein
VSVTTVNLKTGMPSIPQAETRLTAELRSARERGLRVLKIIHGYGSSGVGGDLRIALQSTLRQMRERKEIEDCIFGEEWRKSDDRAWSVVKRFPELKDDSDFGRGNRGITIVVL